MRLDEAPVVDVRGPLTAQRERLLGLLAALTPPQWAAATVAPDWSVKDIAVHLLDVELSWLARDRDGDRSGLIPMPPQHEEFVRALGRRNQQWVEGARGLSPALVTGLLRWSGEQLDAYLSQVDLTPPSSVYWAGPAPRWFDLAREFTERWVHYQQIADAIRPAGTVRPAADPAGRPDDEFLPLVLRTFAWGFPHQYRVPAPRAPRSRSRFPGWPPGR